MDLNRLTVRARGALEGAHQQAVARNHQQIEPVHVLFSLLGDPEGIVYPVLHALGVQPKTVRDRADAELDRIPKVYAQGVEPRFSPTATRMLTDAGTEAEALTDEYISTEHLLLATAAGGDAFASFLLGYPATGSIVSATPAEYLVDYYAGYVQDEFRELAALPPPGEPD